MSEGALVGPVRLVWDPRFRDYDFGPSHPFTERSREAAVELLEASLTGPEVGRFERCGPLEPAPTALLRRFHDLAHLERVREADATGVPAFLDQGDTPAFPGCFDAAARLVSGTVLAVEEALESGGRGFAPGGGLHHAHPGQASGFCIFNDIAVAVASARARGRRVAYVDLDVHHGDGVMYGFYDEGAVLDIDLHQDGRTLFPGTGAVAETGAGDGTGLKVNIPLPPGAGDESLVPLARRLFPPLLREFRPELLIVQHGVDGHAGDPLAQLRYSARGYAAVDAVLLDLAQELHCPVVVTGGGGYRASSVALVLAAAGRALAGLPTSGAALPTGWRRRFEATFGEPVPAVWPVAAAVRSGSTGTADRRVAELEAALGRRFPPVAD